MILGSVAFSLQFKSQASGLIEHPLTRISSIKILLLQIPSIAGIRSILI